MKDPYAGVVTIPLPYGLQPHDLVLDPATSEEHEDAWDILGETEEEEMPRILTSAVALYHHNEGKLSMDDCLHTAMIWERG